jgi:hypothetical protein
MKKSKTKFVQEKDKRGTISIFEVIEDKATMTRYIQRFVCNVGRQETEKKTQELASFILLKLNS